MKMPLEGRWLALAVVLAGVFTGVLMLAVKFVSLPTPPPAKARAPRSGGIGIAPTDSATGSALLKEQALLDPDPLFLPTQFNASELRLPELVRREPGATFQSVSAKYAYTLAEAPIAFPEPVVIPAQPVDSLSYGRTQNMYDVLGRFDREESALPARFAVIEVVQTKTGRTVLSAPLAEGPALLAASDWRPLELLASVDATGLIGLPVLARGSGVEAVDTFFRSYLAKQFRLGERLPPGFYSVRVGP
jgi:hypothetical protein